MASYPNLPGVPPLPRTQSFGELTTDAGTALTTDAGTALTTDAGAQLSSGIVAPPPNAPLTLASVDGAGLLAAPPPQLWGIYLNGQVVVTADTVADVTFKKDRLLSDYPVEQGGFQTYDKVQVPYDARISFASGGTEANRQALLDAVDAIADTLDLYDVVTPEKTYLSANVTHYDYRRTSRNGLGLIVVHVWLLEVRVTASSTFSNTKAPAAADPVNGGTVQAAAPPSSEAQAVAAGIAPGL